MRSLHRDRERIAVLRVKTVLSFVYMGVNLDLDRAGLPSLCSFLQLERVGRSALLVPLTVLLLVLNGWQQRRQFADSDAKGGMPTAALKAMRGLLGTLPFVGPLVAPLWHWVGPRIPRWLVETRAPGETAPTNGSSASWARLFEAQSWLGLTLNVAIPAAWVTDRPEILSGIPTVPALLLAGAIWLQLDLLVLHRPLQYSRRRCIVLEGLIALVALGGLWSGIGVCAYAALAAPEVKGPRMDAFFAGRKGFGERRSRFSGSDWWRPSRWLAWRSSRWILERSHKMEGPRLEGIYRIKAYCLVSDGIGLALLLAAVNRASHGLATLGLLLLGLVTLASAALALVAGLMVGSGGAAKSAGLPPAKRVGLTRLWWSQSSFTVGLITGILLLRSDRAQLGSWFLCVGLIGTTLNVWGALSRRDHGSYETNDLGAYIRLCSPLLAAFVGFAILDFQTWLVPSIQLAALLGFLSPVLSVLVGVRAERQVAAFQRRRGAPREGMGRFAPPRLALFIPLGGLAAPFWPDSAELEGAGSPEVPTETTDWSNEALEPEEPRRGSRGKEGRSGEERAYLYLHLIEHLVDLGQYERLIAILSRTTFLRDQARETKGLATAIRDLKGSILPFVIARADWPNFLYFMTLALNMEGTGDDFLDLYGDSLERMSNESAMDAIRRVSDPWERAAAKAMLAKRVGVDSREFAQLLADLPQEMDSIWMPADRGLAEDLKEKRFWMLILIAQGFGLQAAEVLEGVCREVPEWRDALWINMAERHVERLGYLDQTALEAVKEVENRELLELFIDSASEVVKTVPDLPGSLAIVDSLGWDEDIRWQWRLLLLRIVGNQEPGRVWSLWESWSGEIPRRWGLNLAGAVGVALSRVEPEKLLDVIKGQGEPEIQLAVCLPALSAQGGVRLNEAARRAVERIAEEDLRFHWRLRVFRAQRDLAEPDARREVRHLLRQLGRVANQLDSDDRMSVLEVVAERRSRLLRRTLRRLLLASGAGVDLLLDISKRSDSLPLLGDVFTALDEYIFELGATESFGFLVWRRITKVLVPRLTALGGSVTPLASTVAVDRESANSLGHKTLAECLRLGKLSLAEESLQVVTSPSLRNRLRWKLFSRQGEAVEVDACRHFESFAEADWIEEEILGLRAVVKAGEAGWGGGMDASPIQSWLARFCVLTRLARRGAGVDGSGRTAGLPSPGIGEKDLAEAVGLLTDDAELASILVEVLPIVLAQPSTDRIAEIGTALIGLLALNGLSWLLKRDIFESLLEEVLPILSEETAGERSAGQVERVGEIFLEILQEVSGDGDQVGEERVLTPSLLAALDRLPAVGEFCSRRWGASRLLDLYPQSAEELVESWDREANEDDPNSVYLETILYLLSHRSPEIVGLGLEQIPNPRARDFFSCNLIAKGWLTGGAAVEALALIQDPGLQRKAEIQLRLEGAMDSEAEERWLFALADFAGDQLMDSTDPRYEGWIRRLWRIDPERSRPFLARAALRALVERGKIQGTGALCFWLHAHLAPDAGIDQAGLLALCDEAEEAVGRALRLPDGSPSTTRP